MLSMILKINITSLLINFVGDTKIYRVINSDGRILEQSSLDFLVNWHTKCI